MLKKKKKIVLFGLWEDEWEEAAHNARHITSLQLMAALISKAIQGLAGFHPRGWLCFHLPSQRVSALDCFSISGPCLQRASHGLARRAPCDLVLLLVRQMTRAGREKSIPVPVKKAGVKTHRGRISGLILPTAFCYPSSICQESVLHCSWRWRVN